MSDFEQDPRIARLLNAAGNEATRFIHPQGVQAVQTTIRHRRRNRVVGVAALAAIVLVGGPVTAMNLSGMHTPMTPPAATDSPTASVTPSQSTPAATDTTTPANPTGKVKISANALRNGNLTIPGWPTKGFDTDCPHGQVQFRNGSSGMLKLEGNPVYVDVDHDGTQEAVQVVSCNPQGSDYKVLAFTPGKSGAISTLGQVVASTGTAGKTGDIQTIWGIGAGADGKVRVDVGDFRPCCSMVQASQHQWRTYGWTGSNFAQTGGPASFGANPKFTDLRASSPGLTMTKQPGGSWTGTLTATVRNAAGFVTPDQVTLDINVPGTWKATKATGCTLGAEGSQPIPCTLPAIPKGASRTVTVTLTAPAGTLNTSCTLYAFSSTADGGSYPSTKTETPAKVTVTKA